MHFDHTTTNIHEVDEAENEVLALANKRREFYKEVEQLCEKASRRALYLERLESSLGNSQHQKRQKEIDELLSNYQNSFHDSDISL